MVLCTVGGWANYLHKIRRVLFMRVNPVWKESFQKKPVLHAWRKQFREAPYFLVTFRGIYFHEQWNSFLLGSGQCSWHAWSPGGCLCKQRDGSQISEAHRTNESPGFSGKYTNTRLSNKLLQLMKSLLKFCPDGGRLGGKINLYLEQ